MLITALPITEQKLLVVELRASLHASSVAGQQVVTANITCVSVQTWLKLVLYFWTACWALWLIFLANLIVPCVRSASLRIVHYKPLSFQMILPSPETLMSERVCSFFHQHLSLPSTLGDTSFFTLWLGEEVEDLLYWSLWEILKGTSSHFCKKAEIYISHLIVKKEVSLANRSAAGWEQKAVVDLLALCGRIFFKVKIKTCLCLQDSDENV